MDALSTLSTSSTGFVDARLHISVRPHLEYRIPAAASAVCDALIGDGTKRDALHRLDECVPARRKRDGEREEEEENEEEEEGGHDPRLAELRRACASVCTHAAEHVEAVQRAWLSHVTRVAQAVTREGTALRAAAREAREVRDRYARAHRARGEVVEREYRSELRSIAQRLDSFLAQCRSMDPPSCDRPPSLVEATARLKEEFASAYGTAETALLLRAKRSFERDLARMQDPIAREFVARLTSLLVAAPKR